MSGPQGAASAEISDGEGQALRAGRVACASEVMRSARLEIVCGCRASSGRRLRGHAHGRPGRR